MAFEKGKPKTGGRRPGVTNKATAAAREAIGMFVDNNAERLQGWLDRVADGEKDESGNYVVPPNPEKAFTLFQSVVEYHIPKLARTEMEATVNHSFEDALLDLRDGSSPED